MSDDITFCGSDCNNKKCFRHPSNIREPRIPHSFAYLKDTDDCPMQKQEVRLIDANALKEHKFLSPQLKVIGGRHSGKLKEQITHAYQKGWNDCIDAIIDNAPTVELDGYVLDGTGLELVSTDYLDEQLGKDRRRGKWVEKRDDNGCLQLYCNQCGTKAQVGFISFCGKCGADMQKGGAE